MEPDVSLTVLVLEENQTLRGRFQLQGLLCSAVTTRC